MINNFKDKLDNTPHLMTPQSFINTATFFNSSEYNQKMGVFDGDESCSDEKCNYNEDTGVGTIFVSGTLTYQSEWWQYYYGGTSYESIREQADLLVEKGMTTLLIVGSSGGGEAYNMMETASYLRYLADTNSFKILWYIDGMAASACYGLACTADEIVANPMGEVGSIGVVVRLRNYSEAMKQAGVEDTYIYYGSEKIPYDKSGKWNKEFINRIQESVDSLGEEFTSFVAENRDIPVEDIRSMNAALFSSKEALDLGLIDSVMTHEEFYTYLADYVQKETNPKMLNRILNLTSEQEKIEMKELEAAKSELSAIKVQLEDFLQSKTALESEVITLKASLEDATKQVAAMSEMKAEIEKLQAEKVEAEKLALETKMSERKATLTSVLPADQVEAAMALLGNVEESIFNFTVEGYKAKEAALSKSGFSAELGGQGAPVDHGTPKDPVKAHIEWQKKQQHNSK